MKPISQPSRVSTPQAASSGSLFWRKPNVWLAGVLTVLLMSLTALVGCDRGTPEASREAQPSNASAGSERAAGDASADPSVGEIPVRDVRADALAAGQPENREKQAGWEPRRGAGTGTDRVGERKPGQNDDDGGNTRSRKPEADGVGPATRDTKLLKEGKLAGEQPRLETAASSDPSGTKPSESLAGTIRDTREEPKSSPSGPRPPTLSPRGSPPANPAKPTLPAVPASPTDEARKDPRNSPGKDSPKTDGALPAGQDDQNKFAAAGETKQAEDSAAYHNMERLRQLETEQLRKRQKDADLVARGGGAGGAAQEPGKQQNGAAAASGLNRTGEERDAVLALQRRNTLTIQELVELEKNARQELEKLEKAKKFDGAGFASGEVGQGPAGKLPGPPPATNPQQPGSSGTAGSNIDKRSGGTDPAGPKAGAAGINNKINEHGDAKHGELAQKEVQALKRLQEVTHQNALGKRRLEAEKAARVWFRDRSRPTVARVYCGESTALELVSLHVTVVVDGPRARTIVDHVFRNPLERELEGTFEYPLPSGASPAYFAMFMGHERSAPPTRRFVPRQGKDGTGKTATSKTSTIKGGAGEHSRPAAEVKFASALPADAVANMTPEQVVAHISTQEWGTLQRGQIVGRQKALETYEEIVRAQIDPALLEYAGGNSFSGRVYPIPAGGYNRVILAYEETLPVGGDGRVAYRLPLPSDKTKIGELSVSLSAASADGREPSFTHVGSTGTVSPIAARSATVPGQLLFSHTWHGPVGPGGEVAFRFRPASAAVQAILGRAGEDDPSLYLYARLRPELPAVATGSFASHAVFLLDTSASENPDRFDVSVRLLREILAADPDIEQFNVLTFDATARWASPTGWMVNTPTGRAALLSKLDGLLLEGATNMEAALAALCRPLPGGLADGAPLNVFVLSDGQITWGGKDTATLSARLETASPYNLRFHCYRVGIGSDNAELFDALTRRGGGTFQCFGEADLLDVAFAHRRQCLSVKSVRLVAERGHPTKSPMADVLIAGRRTAVYPGGELVLGARLEQAEALAGLGAITAEITGEFAGKPQTIRIPVVAASPVGGLPSSSGELAARGWAELAVAGLLALDDPALEPLAVAYSQKFGIASRVASFLVLEKAADYQQYGIAAEQAALDKLLTANTRDVGVVLDRMWANLAGPTTPRQELERMLSRAERRTGLLAGPAGEHARRLFGLLADADLELPSDPTGKTADALRYMKDVPTEYLTGRMADAPATAARAMLAEADRREKAGDTPGAVRALSGLIETHPTRSDVLRLVGYRLLRLSQPTAALRLFAQVQHDRPFEPHSYRDLARALQQAKRWGWAALNYEIVLAGTGTWHARFRDTMAVVAREEYIRLMRQAVRDAELPAALKRHFGQRLEQLSGSADGRTPGAAEDDLRVIINWNTDGTDIDLHVTEPDGQKCFYQNQRTRNGGELSSDLTDGYGPERFRTRRAMPGVYTIAVNCYRGNPILLVGETHVEVTVIRYADTPRETVQRYTVVLEAGDRSDSPKTVATVRY